MGHVVGGRRAGAEDAQRDGRHPPAPLREAELPVSDGEQLHERVVLSYSEASRTRFLALPEELIEPVRRATGRYRRARARLEEEANAGLAELARSLGPDHTPTPRAPSRRPRSSTTV